MPRAGRLLRACGGCFKYEERSRLSRAPTRNIRQNLFFAFL